MCCPTLGFIAPILLVASLTSVKASLAATPAASAAGGNVIILVDRSGSMRVLPQPDAVESLIVHLVQVAQLARDPIKFAVIVYGENGVTVIGDKDGLPTAAHATLLQRLKREFPKPGGGTPLADALEKCREALAKLPAQERVTLLHIGDGAPVVPTGASSLPTVAKYRSDRIRQVTASAAPQDRQGLIDELERQWEDPNTPEGKRYWAIVGRSEFDRCAALCETIKAKGPRFVSVDFAGIEPLRKLHEAAGGADEDYLVCQPANQLIQMLHDRGLSRHPGVLISTPLQGTASKKKLLLKSPVNPLADEALVSIVLDKPLRPFDQSVEMAIKAGGRVIRITEATQDPDTQVARDSAGQVAMVSVRLRDLDAIDQIAVGCQPRAAGKACPPLTIYVHQRLSTDAQIVVRPANAPADAAPPYRVSPGQPVTWQAYLKAADGADLSGIASIDASLQSAASAAILLDLAPDPQAAGVFSSRRPMQLPPGQYDAKVSVVFEDGHPVETTLTDHVESRAGDEHLTIELDNTSASPDCLDGGELGDVESQRRVTFRLRSVETSYPVTVQLRVVDLVDSAGNLLPPELIRPHRGDLTIAPGRATTATLDFVIPEHLQQGVEGRVEGRLVAYRTDRRSPMEIRSHKSPSALGVSIDTVRFYLRRPQLRLSAQRAGRDELVRKGDRLIWPVRIDFGVPFKRSLRMVVSTDSGEDREATVRIGSSFVSDAGRSLPGLAVEPRGDTDAAQPISSNQSATWDYCLLTPAELPSEEFTTRVVIEAPGHQTAEIELRVMPRREPLGPSLGAALGWSSCGVALLALGSLVGLARARSVREGKELRLAPGERWEFLEVEQAGPDTLQLMMEQEHLICQRGEGPETPAQPLYLLDKETLSQEPLLVYQETDEGEQGLAVLVHGLDLASGEPVLLARVIDPGPFDQRRSRHSARLFRRTTAAAFAAIVAATSSTPFVLGALQWCWDAVWLR